MACFPAHDKRLCEWKAYHPKGLEVLIDTSASLADIKKHIAVVVHKAKKVFEIKERDFRKSAHKWKYQLIAFDLKREEWKAKDIARLLYPGKHHTAYGDKPYCDPGCKLCKTVNRDYTKAQQLINGQYQHFLFNK